MAGVPTLFEAMMRSEGMKDADLSCFKGVFSGGDSLSVSLKKKVDAFLKEHGANIQVREGYGLTECVTASCLTPIDYYREGSIGIPFPDTYYKIVVPNTNEEAKTKEMGEICISGPTLMKEYINNPKETSQTLRYHDDGVLYLHTGDLGFMEDGVLHFTSRLKRMIISNGYNIYPANIEEVTMKCKKVNACAVVGREDKLRGEKVVVFVVLEQGTSERTVRKELGQIYKKFLAKYEIPREIKFLPELPKNKMAKVDFKKLEEL
jgi:long-chain acyl-CoA synthetase